MLLCHDHQKYFSAKAVSTIIYIENQAFIRPFHNKTLYKFLKGKKTSANHLRTFGSYYYVHNNRKNNLGKFDSRSDEAIFLEYSWNSKVYRVFNRWNFTINEIIYVLLDEIEWTKQTVEDDDFYIGSDLRNLSIY